MEPDNRLFARIILITIGAIVLGFICILPTAIMLSRSGLLSRPIITATPQIQGSAPLQTLVAQVINTQTIMTPTPRAAIPVTGATTTPNTNGLMKVTFINVPRGDAILIETPEGRFGLIDGGPTGGGVLQYLQSHGIHSLDVMIATYPHPDHIGGLTEILRSMPVARVITNGELNAVPEYQDFLNAIAASGAQYFQVKRSDTIDFQNAALQVLQPASLVQNDLKANALVLRLVHGDISYLFMSDAYNVPDRVLLASGQPLGSTVLKVGDHASAVSIDNGFLSAVRPRVAIYTAGRNFAAERPAPGTLQALANAGATVYGTDINGTISVTDDGATINVTTENQGSLATPVPTATPAAVVPVTGGIGLAVANLTSPVRRGDAATLTIQTSAGATCSNIMKVAPGDVNGTDLGTKVAGPDGQVRWDWLVARNAAPATMSIEIFCSAGSQSQAGQIPFVVEP
jgi:competence protein ComEC